ncbi:hypothetical protein KFL_002260030 [Klebsormidium nitens]|uniref:Generative cell specific-1/HAP2 domain-containing protein n=1 Tax=Klebsormidium nitens TaxID=105231 RepID=A0A1Y1I973_KLENI|nr:hypothetical protein KFL_002260030 [Klebsormidium nitens]|eukprot:GAQ85247.1 hypothetical protein KFL_002260030 [Klebsormidium nitens]
MAGGSGRGLQKQGHSMGVAPIIQWGLHALLVAMLSLLSYESVHTEAFVLSSSNLESCVVTGSPPSGNASLQSVDLTTLSYQPTRPVEITFMFPGDLDAVTNGQAAPIPGPATFDAAFSPPITHRPAPAPGMTSSSNTCSLGQGSANSSCGGGPAAGPIGAAANGPSMGVPALAPGAGKVLTAGSIGGAPVPGGKSSSGPSGAPADVEEPAADVSGGAPSVTVSAKLADASSTDITCKNKILVTFIVQNGQTQATDSLEATLSAVTDATGTVRQLAEAYKISIVKTPVYATYPLSFLRSFNAKPYEEIILTNQCQDGALADQATCGWYYAQDGSRVPNSQGFCCKCGVDQTWSDTTGGTSTQQRRFAVNCNVLTNSLFLTGIPATASCLRMSADWYPAYLIGAASLDFQLQITVNRMLPSDNGRVSNGSAVQTLILSPSVPVAKTTEGNVLARLPGDLASYTQLPVFSDRYLMIPQTAAQAGRLTANTSTWMFIDKTQVNLDGTVCNMIGTSFTAFRNQPNRCEQYAGTCLANQLVDLAKADAARVAAGLVPQYLVSGYGISTGAADSSGLKLKFVVNQILSSVVSLELNADEARYLVNRSPGKIVSAVVPTFEAVSRNGNMAITVQNNGTLVADYTLTVQNCSDNILPIQAQMHSIAPNATQDFAFPVVVQDDQATQRNCTGKRSGIVFKIILYDSVGEITDISTVFFYTNATFYDKGAQGGNLTVGQTTNSTVVQAQSPPTAALTCVQLCPSIFSVSCAFLTGCWSRIVSFIGLMITIIAVLFVLVVMYRLGIFSMCFQCCAALCRVGAKPRSASRERIRARSGSADADDDARTSRSSSKKSSASLRRRSSSGASDAEKAPSSPVMSRTDPYMAPSPGASITGFALPSTPAGMPGGSFASPSARAFEREGFGPFGSVAGGFGGGGNGNPSFGFGGPMSGLGHGSQYSQPEGSPNRFSSMSPTSRIIAQSAFAPGYQSGFGNPLLRERPGGYTLGSGLPPNPGSAFLSGHGSAFAPGQEGAFASGQGVGFGMGQGGSYGGGFTQSQGGFLGQGQGNLFTQGQAGALAPGQGSGFSLNQGGVFPPSQGSPTRFGGASVAHAGFGAQVQRAFSAFHPGGQIPQAKAPPVAIEMTQEALVQAAGTGTIVYLNFENASASSQLHSPGPCCSLAGHLVFTPDGGSVQFTLAPGRDYQRRYFEPATGCYQPLPAPRPLDCQFFTANMGIGEAVALTSMIPKGDCIN